MLSTEWIPARQPDSKHLMIVLHGLGDSLEGFRFLPDALGLPDVHFLLVNAPDEYYGGYSWYNFEHSQSAGVERSRLELNTLLDEQRAKGFASENIFLFGFSQGCLMTFETGLRYSHRLAGLIGISGYVLDAAELILELSPVAKNQRMLWTHGTRDPIIPCAKAKQQMVQLQSAGLDIEWKEFNKEHTIAGEAEVGVIRTFAKKNMGFFSNEGV